MNEIKNDKADGGDGVVVEKVTELANRMYDSDDIPEKMMKNLFITFPKRQAQWNVRSIVQMT